MKADILSALNEERRARRAVIRVTDLETGAERLIRESDDCAADPLSSELEVRFRSGKSGTVETASGSRAFLTVCVPPPRLVVIGAVHISQALGPIAATAGFDMTVVDPRTAFATPERFPGVDLRPDWPDDVLDELALDRYTALAAVTHDPKIDDTPLIAALNACCFYVGALGSRKTHAKRVERLTAAGLAPQVIGRIHAPIGLDIGAASPAEIAVSIMAEIIATLRAPRAERRGAAA